MASFTWLEEPDHLESLAVSLRSVLAAHGQPRDYGDVLALLGLGAATVAVPDRPLRVWSMYARDAAVPMACELLGMQLRELHPPGAAEGLGRSAEFAQHFRDSYVPLISRALSCGQRVLVWRGWPPPRERLWGVITEIHGDLLAGYSLWHNTQPLPLIGPAHQAYVIEDCCDPISASPARLFDHVLELALVAWSGGWSSSPRVLSGPAAYEAWRERLAASPAERRSEWPLYRQHSRASQVLVSSRGYLAAWLGQIADTLDPERSRVAQAWGRTLGSVIAALFTCVTPEQAKTLLEQPDGAARAAEAVALAAEAEGEFYSDPRVRDLAASLIASA